MVIAVVVAGTLPSPGAASAHASESSEGLSDAHPEGQTAAPADAAVQRSTAESEGRDSARTTPASGASASSAPSDEEAAMAAANLPTRPGGASTLIETLTEIERRMSGGGSELTESDVEALRAYAEASPGPLGTAIRDLLSAPTEEKALAQIRALLANPSTGSADRIRADDGSGSLSDQLESEAAGSVPPDASAPSRADATPVTSEAPSDRGGVYPFFSDEMSGASTIELVGATLPSSVGEAGEYSYYITKSVPVEPPAGVPTAAGTPRSLSFERASSIAAGRALPSDVLDAVREYFTQITEGGS